MPRLVTFGTGWGLWRSPVAHLVRIEGARGSNPLSSTIVVLFTPWPNRCPAGVVSAKSGEMPTASCPPATPLCRPPSAGGAARAWPTDGSSQAVVRAARVNHQQLRARGIEGLRRRWVLPEALRSESYHPAVNSSGVVDLHAIHFGDLPGWLGAVGTVAAVSLALYQVNKERSAREADKREAAAADRRRQARQISAWYAGDAMGSNGDTSMYMVNSSDQPVYEAVAWLTIAQGAGPKQGEEYVEWSGSLGVDYYRRIFLNIPPGNWSIAFPTSWGGMYRQPGIEIAFTDSGGYHWIRRANGGLEEISKAPLDYYNIVQPVNYATLSSISDSGFRRRVR